LEGPVEGKLSFWEHIFGIRVFSGFGGVRVNGFGKIICGQCENHIQTTLKKETLISDYFKPKKNIFNDGNLFTNMPNIYSKHQINPKF
jgi:hypothetical protein